MNKLIKKFLFLENEYSFNNFSESIELNPTTLVCKKSSIKKGVNISELYIFKQNQEQQEL